MIIGSKNSMKALMVSLCYCLAVYSYGQLATPLGSLSKETGLLLKDDVTRMLIHNSSGDRAHDYVRQISMWDRSGYEQNYNDAANWVKAKAQEFGLSEVEMETYPVNGETDYYGSKPDSPWIVKKGELWAVSPYNFKITSYDDLPMSLAMNSASVDTVAELVDVGNGLLESDYEGKDVKNKIVLASQSPSTVARIAMMKKGAIGVISSYTVPYWDLPNRLPGDFPDQVGWSGIYVPNNPEAFAFMISDRNRRELISVLNQKKKMTLKVSIETEKKPGAIKIISGIIKGSQFPDEEIIITSHLDHYKPGANDNASGCAVSLEMVRTLNYLISTKQLSPPLRTIRFLWFPEFDGSVAWFSRHANESKKRIVNLNFDMLGADLVEVNSQFAITYTPDWNGHFINALSESTLDFINKYNDTRYAKRKDYQIISVNGTRNPSRGVMSLYSRGSDHQIFNDFGIAGIGYDTWPDDNYHSSQDSPDHVDPT
jgi:Peptidase family M28